jgi:hypothetical protein
VVLDFTRFAIDDVIPVRWNSTSDWLRILAPCESTAAAWLASRLPTGFGRPRWPPAASPPSIFVRAAEGLELVMVRMVVVVVVFRLTSGIPRSRSAMKKPPASLWYSGAIFRRPISRPGQLIGGHTRTRSPDRPLESRPPSTDWPAGGAGGGAAAVDSTPIDMFRAESILDVANVRDWRGACRRCC